MLKMKIQIRVSCPNHTRYNPEKNGLTFKAGCRYCEAIWLLYKKAVEVRRQTANIEDDTRKTA